MKEQYHLVSFSGGKDSTAMLLGMLERDIKIDCILFCDTGLEFPAMYDHIAKVEKDIGRKITIVRAEHTYEELMFDVPVRRSADSPVVRQYGAQLNGYGWPGPRQRWCTTRLKAMPRERFLRELYQHFPVLWNQLKTCDKRTWRNFRADYSVEDLEVRFLLEREWTAAGKSIRSRAFFTALRERMEASR